MPRFLCAALVLYAATLRAATGFPELPGFFAETSSGIYQARGARLAVTAQTSGVYLGGIALQHLGANTVSPVGADALNGAVRTYRGRQATTAPAYRAVEYRDLYPGITLRLSFDGRAMKADYVVAPGADPRVIAFRYDGVQAVLENGDLLAGDLRQPAPIVLQDGKPLPSRYVLDAGNWVRFEIAAHDPSLPLLIDPYVVTGSAYFGGGMTDRITAMAVDSAGYIYVAGSTESTNFPLSPIRPRADGVEAFVLKLNPSNLQIVYATYLGGTGDDRALGIAVDASGSAYVAGFTGSTDFPAPSPAFAGGSTDAFLVRLTPAGALQFSTLIGGTGADVANGVALKSDGSAWIVGETGSSNLPLVGVAYQAVNRGGTDAFLSRITGTGSIAYTGYFGGSGDDRGVAIALDTTGSVYFTGGTASGNFPYANAFRSYNAGLQDAFVAKLSSDGGTLNYSTYLGGSAGVPGQGEVGNWITVDTTGAAFIVGVTSSNDFPVTAATAIQPLFGGGATDAFVAKISAAGNTLLYSTYFGGVSTDEGWAGAVRPDGAFYFGGNTASPSLPPQDSLQSTLGGDLDGFFVKLSSNLGALQSFSYLGYTGTESVNALAVTSSSVILAGSSSSPAWLPSGGFKGWYDGWVMTLAENANAIQMNSTPAGIPFTVSGTGCSPTSATTPATLAWVSGASCTVAFNGTQDSGTTRSIFQNWQDGISSNPRTFVASHPTASYTMQFATEHRLTRSVSPAGAGSVTGADGFYAAGSTVALSASANPGYQFIAWSGGASGAVNPASVTMNAPQTVIANFSVLTTIASAAAVPVTITGSGCAAGSYTAPVTLAWTSGATCTISFNAINTVNGVRSTFVRWADGSTASPRTIPASGPGTYTLEWSTEYQLTRTVAGSGSVSGADGFYAAGTSLNLAATPTSGYQFAGWSGDAGGTANPLTVVMNAPKSITASFVQQTAQVHIGSNVASLQFSVSGTGCVAGTYTAPVSFTWAEGVSCTITIPVIQGGDVRWIFETWGDGNANNTRIITATASPVTYTMQFATHYKLTRLITGQGSIDGPADGYYPAGTSIQLTAIPASAYQFTSWSGNFISSANPLTFALLSPSTVTANFSAAPVAVSFSANVTAQFSIAGSGCPTGTYTTPANVVWTNGTACTVTPVSPQGGQDTRYVFASWGDGSTAPSRILTATSGASYSITFTTEHKLTRTVTGSGSVNAADGFYTAGSTVQLTATPSAGHQFTGWSGAVTGAANPVSIVMNGPKSVTATFAAAPTAIRIEANASVQVDVSGSGCPTGTYTAPVTVSWLNGSACSIAVASPQGNANTRWTFTGWADGSTANPRSITAAQGAVYTLAIATEHRLTRSVIGSGSISGADGFYTAGSTIQLTATPQAGHQFSGWSGSATGVANPLSVVMDNPKSITASFSAVATGIRFESNTPAAVSIGGIGCPAGAYSTPVTLNWTTGTVCDVSVQGPTAGSDTRWVFSRWADGPATTARSVIAAPGAVYSILFAVEYRITRGVSGPGSVSGTDGFYAAGATMQLSATPQSGYLFTGWSGSATGTTNPLSVFMDSAKNIVATFAAASASVRFEANVNTQFALSGTGCPGGSHTTPATLAWAGGSSCSVSVASPHGSGDTRWVFHRWADGPTANPRSVAASAGAVYNVVMGAEHRLTRSVSGSGSVSGTDGYYPTGTAVQLTATPQAGYQFAGWSGSATGTANPLNVTMNAAKSIVATFTTAPVTVRIDSNTATQFTVSGAGCPTGTHTAPVNLAWANGAGCAITAISPQGGPDSRWVFAQWADGPTTNPRTVAAVPGGVYTLIYIAEHRLTRTVSGQGIVSGSDAFYPLGTSVQLTATAAEGHQFSGWSGTGGGSANPVTIRIDGPTNMVANFTPIQGIAVETFSPLVGGGANGTFTATFSHGRGAGELYLGYMLFLPTSNVVQYTAKGSCLIEYNRISHGMRLIDDPGTGWLGPVSGVPISPNAGILRNSQCTLNVAAASASISGNTMTVTAPVTFHSGASPVMATFLQGLDVKDNWTGMTQYGNWVYSGGSARPGPSIPGVASSATQGSYAVYSITASHTSGAAWLSMIHLLIGDRIVGGLPCQAVYFPGDNTLNLINDNGTALVAPGMGVIPGTAGSIANSRCSINTALASRSAAGNNVTITIPMNFQPSTFGGLKRVYANAFDIAGQLSHWVQAATLNVQ